MAAKDRETSDFSVNVDIFENSLGISCGVRGVDVKGSEVMCEKGLKTRHFKNWLQFLSVSNS